MTSRITRRTALGLAAAVPLVAIGKPALADPLVVKFSHVVTPDAPKGKAALLFKQLAEKYTADRSAIATDVIAMLQDLADKGFLTEAREKTS